MERGDILGVGLLTILLVSVLSSGTAIPSMLGYVFVVMVYGVVLSICYIRGFLSIHYDRLVLYPILALWALFLLNFVRYPTGTTLLRTAAFIVFTGINLFVLPATFSREQFFDALSIVATAIAGIAVPIAIPAILAGTEGIGVWRINQGTPILASIFTNPNYLAGLSAFGLIALFGFARTTRRRRLAIPCALLCLLGLAVSQGRAALLALVGALVLIAVYRLGGTRAVTGVVVLGIVGATVTVALIIGWIPDTLFPDRFFTHRGGLWRATLRAVDARPVLGWGLVEGAPIIRKFGAPTPAGSTLGVHNSYLRIFMNVGVLGGWLYFLLCVGVLAQAVQSLRGDILSSNSYLILSLLAATLTLQLFSSSTIFGLSAFSMVEAVVFGFAQQPDRTISARRFMRAFLELIGFRDSRLSKVDTTGDSWR